MADLIPDIRGPKLFPFKEDISNAQFVKLLGSNDGNHGHGRVFQVVIDERTYAIKIFKFVTLADIRRDMFVEEHLVSDYVARHHLDPFFAECRAFGHLVEVGKDNELAVRCHGYLYLPKSVERRIEQQFGIHDWNRSLKDEDQPLRGIVKDYIKYKSFRRPSKFHTMRARLLQLNKMGIFNMDIRKENYLGGRLFDFSVAITMPHLSFSVKIRTQDQILKDSQYDIGCFDSMVKEAIDQDDGEKTKRWGELRMLPEKEHSSQESRRAKAKPPGREPRSRSERLAAKTGRSRKEPRKKAK